MCIRDSNKVYEELLSVTKGASSYNIDEVKDDIRDVYKRQMYDRYIVEHSYNIDGSTLVKIPTPRYTVLYNGTSKQPAFMKMCIRDSYSA